MESAKVDVPASQTPGTCAGEMENGLEICNPISNVEDLWTFLDSPPAWTKTLIDFQPRGLTVVANKHIYCHRGEDNSDSVSKRLDFRLTPRTLVCHDMKNGYLEDKYVGSFNKGNGYTFYRWSQIDIFVYFSHHFITVPPHSWINVAHKNGVKILGTFITEWDAGVELCKKFLKDPETIRVFVHALVDVVVLCKLDGFLLNIENQVENTPMLVQFVSVLTEVMHKKRPGSLVIWYDSVISDGALAWQNELNQKNKCFFDVCDGIFLNYTWKEKNLVTTLKNAEHRFMDVYVGIDVFGRNTFGGGKFNCHAAAKEVRSRNMSLAIFAPGWTHQSLEAEPVDTFFERFLDKDNTFWRSLWPFLYTHPINRFFDTFFYVGSDKKNYQLHKQEVQLSRYLHAKKPLDEESKISTLHGQCNCLRSQTMNDRTPVILVKTSKQPVHVHHLFTCDIPVEGNVILYTYTAPLKPEQSDFLNVTLLIQEEYTFRKIVCNSSHLTNSCENLTLTMINSANNEVIAIETKDRVPENATLRCYEMKFTGSSRILEILGEIERSDSVILYGLGIRQMNVTER